MARKQKTVCEVEGCERKPYALDLCTLHYRRLKSHGSTEPAPKRDRSTWTPRIDAAVPGTRYYDSHSGYVRIYMPGHSNANAKGQVKEHVLVMSEALGRPLRPAELVHHINGVRHDNRLENLELWSTSHPKGQRVDDLVEWAQEILACYQPNQSIISS